MAERDPIAYAWLMVFGSWGLSGAAVGTSVGLTAQVTLGVADAAPQAALLAAFGAAALGGVALWFERGHATGRPELTDTRGARSRPLHGALLAFPALAALPALLWLVLVASVGLRSLVPAVVFGSVAVAVGWAAARAIARHRLNRALEALEIGAIEVAVPALHRLAEPAWVGRSVRSAARLNLAMLALNAGNGEEAVQFAAGVSGGSARAWALVTESLGRLLQNEPLDEAERCLAEALNAPGGKAVQPEADAVRVLLVWRREGPVVAQRMAEGLLGPGATALHRALLAKLRDGAGDAAGAEQLRSAEVRGFLTGGLAASLGELR